MAEQSTKAIIFIYQWKYKIRIEKENALPVLIRVGNEFIYLGGLVGFWVSSFFIGLKGFFIAKDSLRKKGKVIEFKLRK